MSVILTVLTFLGDKNVTDINTVKQPGYPVYCMYVYSFSLNLAFALQVYVICKEMPSRGSEAVAVEKRHLTYFSLNLKEISCHCEQCFDTVHSTLYGSDCM